MPKTTDIRPIASTLHFLPVETRMPLKFGAEVTTEVTCARVRLVVRNANGQVADGWGETPLSVHWIWPSTLSYSYRHEALKQLCLRLAEAWATFSVSGHPIEIGDAFQELILPKILGEINATRQPGVEPMPWLAALVACSAFDIALHDAFGKLLGLPIYETYTDEFMNADLSKYLEPAEASGVSFHGRYPADYLVFPRASQLSAWHLVGGKDPIEPTELTGMEPDDGYPVLLRDWIKTDGLTCLKVKLRGDDCEWDFDRLRKVGQIALQEGVNWLSADFNCNVKHTSYVIEILERWEKTNPVAYKKLLYVEQPFPYELERHKIDVHDVSRRKLLFLDESAHDWRLIRLGRELGWTGVALKTCKTQTGALLALCWTKAHQMDLMVQDLTNPMLAQIPHLLLAAHAETLMGVETNAMQFYPEASLPESKVHPGLYRRKRGLVELITLDGPGFGYRIDEIGRELLEAAFKSSS